MDNTFAKQIERNRHLIFSGVKNFRDLGGYPTNEGKSVRWGMLYRSDGLHKLTDADLRKLSELNLHHIVDFRSAFEKEIQPDRLPADLLSRLIEIPILDNSTQSFQGSRDEVARNLKKIDAVQFMTRANIEFASRFTSEMKQFIDVLMSASGRPVLFHCTAGKDRTGFAAAILLRILGVPHDVVVEDYLLTNRYFYSSYRWRLMLLRLLRGKQFASVVKNFMMAQTDYLAAAFEVIDRDHGSFDKYVSNGLGVTPADIEKLKSLYLQ